MFEKFTDRARRVLVLAQEEARMLNHSYVGTEHILLGLVHEDEGVAAVAFRGLGISADAVREQVEEMVGRGGISPSGQIPFTPRAKKVMELSLRESLHLGHNYIGTEHILLGLLREGQGVGAQVLLKLGADLDRVRREVNQQVSAHEGEETATSFFEEPWTSPAVAYSKVLGEISEILTTMREIAQRVERIERHLTGTDDKQQDG
jgi:ATP-dependent Clp protease ATP-binding subunit ClpC